MRNLFVDTGAWLALADRHDEHHEQAARFYRQRDGKVRWVTSDFVLDELATRLSSLRGPAAAVTFVRRLRSKPAHEVLEVDGVLFDEALSLMSKFSDHRLSFTDCSSFALMRELRIPEAFGFDADFTECGFQLLP